MNEDLSNKLLDPSQLGVVGSDPANSEGCCGGKPTCCRTEDSSSNYEADQEPNILRMQSGDCCDSSENRGTDPYASPFSDSFRPSTEALIMFEQKTNELETNIAKLVYEFYSNFSSDKPSPHLVDSAAVLATACVLSMRQAFMSASYPKDA